MVITDCIFRLIPVVHAFFKCYPGVMLFFSGDGSKYEISVKVLYGHLCKQVW